MYIWFATEIIGKEALFQKFNVCSLRVAHCTHKIVFLQWNSSEIFIFTESVINESHECRVNNRWCSSEKFNVIHSKIDRLAYNGIRRSITIMQWTLKLVISGNNESRVVSETSYKTVAYSTCASEPDRGEILIKLSGNPGKIDRSSVSSDERLIGVALSKSSLLDPYKHRRVNQSFARARSFPLEVSSICPATIIQWKFTRATIFLGSMRYSPSGHLLRVYTRQQSNFRLMSQDIYPPTHEIISNAISGLLRASRANAALQSFRSGPRIICTAIYIYIPPSARIQQTDELPQPRLHRSNNRVARRGLQVDMNPRVLETHRLIRAPLSLCVCAPTSPLRLFSD